MVYKHKKFSLNTETRGVYDENNKLLRITGNVYRTLVFLCANKAGTITEIGEYLDRAKEYNEDHLRQYKYKINTIIGADIVKYYNNIYSIEGQIDVVDGCNKDLLRENDLVLNNKEYKNMSNEELKIKFYKWPAIVGIISILTTLPEVPYGVYNLNKVILTAVAICYAYWIKKNINKQDAWFWILIGIAVLFNPIIPIHLGDKLIWAVIDIAIIIFLIMLMNKFKEK